MLVSIVMAVYNAEDYVEEAIKSKYFTARSYEIRESIKDAKVKLFI
ncbi:hypothetical protein [Fictibacillus enclensis]|nr:hypothetical protein [Fictibacillus enclensis]WHY74224.1 hypothetical protein QNH15_10070 [Fictibacillus enclensis]